MRMKKKKKIIINQLQNYIECKSNSDRNKTLSVKKYHYKIRPI